MRISDWSSDVCSSDLMPTDTGLRLFVDGMMQALEPSADERAAIEARIERGSGPIEDALAATTAALSGLSACAGLVFVPKRSEEHTSELQSLMRISYAVFCLKKKKE